MIFSPLRSFCSGHFRVPSMINSLGWKSPAEPVGGQRLEKRKGAVRKGGSVKYGPNASRRSWQRSHERNREILERAK